MLIHLCLSATDARVTAPEGITLSCCPGINSVCWFWHVFWSEPYFFIFFFIPAPHLGACVLSHSYVSFTSRIWECVLVAPVSPGYETAWVAWLTFPFWFVVAAVFQLFYPVVPLLFSSLPRWVLLSSTSAQREQHHGDRFLCKTRQNYCIYREKEKSTPHAFSRCSHQHIPAASVPWYIEAVSLNSEDSRATAAMDDPMMTLATVPWTVWIFKAFQRLASRLQIRVVTLITLDLMGSSLSGFLCASEHFLQSAGGRPCCSPLHL